MIYHPHPSPLPSRERGKCPEYVKALVIGGTRSGKSAFALKLAEKFDGTKAYIATAEPLDPEMKERIESHRRLRSGDWDTFEEPIKVPDLVGKISSKYSLILVDCLTLWLSNMMGMVDKDLTTKEIERLVDQTKQSRSNIIFVSNEVGMGIVPDNELARSFRDLSGLMNQKIAEVSSEVHLIFSGLPVRIK